MSEKTIVRWKIWIPLLSAPGLAGLIYNIWIRVPGAASDDSLIVPFLFLLMVQFAGIPIGMIASVELKKKNWSLFTGLAVLYAILTLYSFSYAFALGISVI